jgi:sugar/nucleoside kinase (ribokinase family)
MMRIPDAGSALPRLKLALQTSIVAAGLSTQQPGAMSSIPSKLEVETQLAAYLDGYGMK